MVVDTTKAAATSQADDEALYVLDENVRLQQKTMETMKRVKDQAHETELEGVLTLEDLKRQRGILSTANGEADRLNAALDDTKQLQNRLGRWTLTFGRGNEAKRAKAAAAAASQKKFGRKKKKETLSKLAKSEQRKEKPARDDPTTRGAVAGNSDILLGVTAETMSKHEGKFAEIEENDRAIDEMLGETADILVRLGKISANVQSEVQAHEGDLEELEKSLAEAADKHIIANSRARKFLTGKWRNRAEE